jgi:hypothetical protein
MIKNQYTFTELFTTAPVNKIYEVIQPNASLQHKKVFLGETEGLKARVLKKVEADGSHRNNGGEGVLQAFGGYTAPTTRYRILDDYVQVDVTTAFDYIRTGKNVFVKDKWGDYERVARLTDFEDIGVRDFDDLFERRFYVPESEVGCASCPF